MTNISWKTYLPRPLLLAIGGWCLTGVLLLVFFQFLLPPSSALEAYRHSTYWFCWAWLLLFVVVLWRVWQAHGRKRKWSFGWSALVGLGLSLVASVFVLTRESRQFKIFTDEPHVAGMVHSFYWFQKAESGERQMSAALTGDIPLVLQGSINKRPPLVPFIASLWANLRGYAPDRIWEVNAVGVVLFFIFHWRLGMVMAGEMGGLVIVLLWCTVAQLSRSAAGMGLEVLNLTLITTLTLVLWENWKRPSTALQELALLLGIGLTLTRYESAIFFPMAVVGVGAVWWREGRGTLSLPMWLVPFLLLPFFLLNQIYRGEQDQFQTHIQGTVLQPFGIQYLWPNLQSAFRHFFTLQMDQPNSLPAAILGCAGLLFLVWSTQKQSPSQRFFLRTLAPFFCVLCGITLLFNYGQFDMPITQRLALPVYFLLILGAVVGLEKLWATTGGVILATCLLGFLWWHTVPQTSRHEYSRNYLPAAAMDWVIQLVKANPNRPSLILSTCAQPWIAYGQSCTAIEHANQHPQRVAWVLQNLPSLPIYLFERYKIDPLTNAVIPADPTPLSAEFMMETGPEIWVHPESFVRLNRVVGVSQAAQEKARQLPVNPTTIEEWRMVFP